MQSESGLHDVRHADAPQTNGAQLFVVGAGHEPAPLHAALAVWVPDVQDADRQEVELPG
jgi:hypothetical protein